MKHTPGSWKFEDSTPGGLTGLRFEIFAPKGEGDRFDYRIAETSDGGQQAKANARLIASAPELLEACKEAEKLRVSIYSPDDIKNRWDEIMKVLAICGQIAQKAEA